MKKKWFSKGIGIAVVSVIITVFISDVSAQTTVDITHTGNNQFTVNVNPVESYAIQGYEVVLTFPSSEVTVTSIDYLQGTSSKGLADDNTTLSNVNNAGRIRLVGEIPSATGQQLNSGNPLPIVSITVESSGSSSVSIEEATVFRINPDGSIASEKLTIQSGSAADQMLQATDEAGQEMNIFQKILNFFLSLIKRDS